VGICVERSLEMVVGVLGILKAGGAYVPLDPGYPAARLGYLLEDSAPQLVLTHAPARERLQAGLQAAGLTVPVLDLQADAPQWSQHSIENAPPATLGLRSAHLAY